MFTNHTAVKSRKHHTSPSAVPRAVCLLPLAIAVAAGIELASPLISLALLAAGVAASLAARLSVLRASAARLCSWSEVERALDRALRRERIRRRLYGAPQQAADGMRYSTH